MWYILQNINDKMSCFHFFFLCNIRAKQLKFSCQFWKTVSYNRIGNLVYFHQLNRAHPSFQLCHALDPPWQALGFIVFLVEYHTS